MFFDLPKEQSSIIKVIGIGGGGCNAVNHMFRQGIRDVNFVICNTDAQALESSPVPVRIQLGPELTKGRGAGSHPEMGKEASLESMLEIKQILENDTEMVFITAGMGGGTGTGGAPVVARIAREMGILTVGIVTLPFGFEGKKRIAQAHKGIAELKEHVDSIIVIVNDKIREVFGNLSFSDAFSRADDILTTAAKGIAEIITIPGYVNVDFEDVKTVLSRSGVAIMGTGTASGQNRALESVESALTSPLLNDTDIRGARHVLLNITSGKKEVTMDEISEITEYVQEAAGMDSDIIWGNCLDENMEDELSVTVIATGFEAERIIKEAAEPKVEKIVHALETAPEHQPQSPVIQPEEPVLKKIEPQVRAPWMVGGSVAKVADETKKIDFEINAERDTVAEESALEMTDESFDFSAVSENDFSQPELTPDVLTADEEDVIGMEIRNESFPEPDQDALEPLPEAPEFDEEFVLTGEDTRKVISLDADPVQETPEENADPAQITFEFELPAVESPIQTPVGEVDDVHWSPSMAAEISVNEEEKKLKVRTVYPDLRPSAIPQRSSQEEESIPIQKVPEKELQSEPVPPVASKDEQFRQVRRTEDDRRKKLHNLSIKLSNVEELEKTPAYLRRNVDLSDTPHSSEDNVSRYQLGETEEGEDGPEFRRRNSFLHDNVD